MKRKNQKSNRIEILAPAGGEEALRAAVYTGADAVYLGGKSYGARAAAQNFERPQILAAVRFCHGRGVRVYVTVNTLLKDREFSKAIEYVKFLCDCGVDAVIVQDMGLYRAIQICAPALRVHASTQMSVHNALGVRLLEDLGMRRVVLARELSYAEIQEIAEVSAIELEVFIHGAQCMSISGQCYFSAMLGSRSGNRGMCAQTCRLPFSHSGGNGYALSLKDLTLVDKLAELSTAGIASAKIEGRMKRPEYVAAVVHVCKAIARGETVRQEEWDMLSAVFSRFGFTDGYYSGKLGREMFGIRTKEDVVGATQTVLSELRSLYRRETPKIPVFFSLSQVDRESTLTVSDRDGNCGVAAIQNQNDMRTLSQERCMEQLAKTGGTPFYADHIEVLSCGFSGTISALNQLRRDALQQLLESREAVTPIPFYTESLKAPVGTADGSTQKPEKLPLWGEFRSIEQLPQNSDELERILLPLQLGVSAIVAAALEPVRVILELPRAFFWCSGGA